jgi:hypothetical protein
VGPRARESHTSESPRHRPFKSTRPYPAARTRCLSASARSLIRNRWSCRAPSGGIGGTYGCKPSRAAIACWLMYLGDELPLPKIRCGLADRECNGHALLASTLIAEFANSECPDDVVERRETLVGDSANQDSESWRWFFAYRALRAIPARLLLELDVYAIGFRIEEPPGLIIERRQILYARSYLAQAPWRVFFRGSGMGRAIPRVDLAQPGAGPTNPPRRPQGVRDPASNVRGVR